MKKLLLLLPILLTGCALSSASHQTESEGRYIVSASGNNLDNEETLLKTINKRATKLCGDGNYQTQGDSDVVRTVTIAPIKTLTRTIVCQGL